ncbi:DUF3558 domain-containing protein [Streptomyces sp. H27-C3]|uniref:DUF3558 domain-containing protein n=1 Tax=Streptomyces sp. H27-C3 TaxID=3046305 RepID=UPI0024B98C41|nr:DUF3558 domain-containing protein [Streptomyces sp. H27-C3]MDJ0465604.1 DUF3558 domain-containing protein [Streptomyces sp. H27-C3]
MQRKVFVPGVALLAALAAGCTGGSGTEDSTTDSKAGDPATSTAPDGKYRTLREPCGSVDRGMLRDLLPGATSLPPEQQEKAYAGTADVTYDTDRRVGCRWKAGSPEATHQLVVDFERVVSYDTTVSDDDRADEVYAKQVTAAQLPSPSASPEDEETEGEDTERAGDETDGTSPSPGADASPSASSKPSGTPDSDPRAPSQTPEGLQPRTLDGLGDAAFLDDALAGSDSTARRRTVSVVFRTSNVIVTVRYSAQPALMTTVPDSKELQEKARAVARRLAEQFTE